MIGKLLVVAVGNDERPAGPDDLDNVKESIEKSADGFVTHHAIAFHEIDLKEDETVVVSIGNEERPASDSDIGVVLKAFKEAEESNAAAIVMHHAVSLQKIRKLDKDAPIVVVKSALYNFLPKEGEDTFTARDKELLDKTVAKSVCLSKIKLKLHDGVFECDRISGNRDAVRKDGFDVIGDEAGDKSIMWDFENVDIKPKDADKVYNVELHFHEDDNDESGGWYGDISFDHFAVGYAESSDFEVISGFDPFKGTDKS